MHTQKRKIASVGENVEKLEPSHVVGRSAVTMERVWHLFTKLSIELLHDPVIPLLNIYPKERTSQNLHT
jgi:hypothetical protein